MKEIKPTYKLQQPGSVTLFISFSKDKTGRREEISYFQVIPRYFITYSIIDIFFRIMEFYISIKLLNKPSTMFFIKSLIA